MGRGHGPYPSVWREGPAPNIYVQVPTDDMLLLRLSTRDDYLSSVPKFFLALKDMFERHPTAKWFVLVGCDNFVEPYNLVDELVKFDPASPVLAGEIIGRTAVRHITVPGMDKHGSIEYLGGGAGLVFSNGLLQQLHRRLEPFVRSWLTGKGAFCIPCADVAFTVLAAQLGVELTSLDCVTSWWPERHSSTLMTHLMVGDEIRCTPHWASPCPLQSVFHYIKPRGMRLLYEYFRKWRRLHRAKPHDS